MTAFIALRRFPSDDRGRVLVKRTLRWCRRATRRVNEADSDREAQLGRALDDKLDLILRYQTAARRDS